MVPKKVSSFSFCCHLAVLVWFLLFPLTPKSLACLFYIGLKMETRPLVTVYSYWRSFFFCPFVSLTVQERVASVRGSQTDIADEKASIVIEQCQSTLVNARMLFDQALTPSTCAACLNSEFESDSRESLADKVNRADTSFFFCQYIFI